MLSYLVPNRMAVPPPHAAENGRAPNRRAVGRDHSATAFVANAIFVAMAAFASVTLIATAPPTVMLPILVTLVAGLAASVLAVKADEWIARRRGRRLVGGRSADFGPKRRSNAPPVAFGSR